MKFGGGTNGMHYELFNCTHYGYSFRPYYYAVTRRTVLSVLQGT